MGSAESFDAVIIGSGFGGLAAALSLAERGRKVALLERLNYPGGCASTFSRDGYEFEAGATLFSGFAANQPFSRWIERHRLDVQVDWIDPMVELRGPDLSLLARRSREAQVQQFLDLPDAPQEALIRFFQYQRSIADALWPLFEAPEQIPPFGPGGLLQNIKDLPRYFPLISAVGRSLGDCLKRFGIHGFRPLKVYLDALCQITLQCSADEAEAPFALSTMDYYHRGTGHVRGGIGNLARALAHAITPLGGTLMLSTRAKKVEKRRAGYTVHTSKGALQTKAIVANMLPEDALALNGASASPKLRRMSTRIDEGWGAVMLYRVVHAPPGARKEAHHLELIDDDETPLIKGNHLFCSISEAHRDSALRTMTVSTHVPFRELNEAPKAEQGALIASIQQRMRALLQRRAPEWTDIVHELTASPRTFARFTGRSGGRVGGAPRRVGLHNYRDFTPPQISPRFYLVGDSIFPGQSTLATAVGGQKVAALVDAAL